MHHTMYCKLCSCGKIYQLQPLTTVAARIKNKRKNIIKAKAKAKNKKIATTMKSWQ